MCGLDLSGLIVQQDRARHVFYLVVCQQLAPEEHVSRDLIRALEDAEPHDNDCIEVGDVVDGCAAR